MKLTVIDAKNVKQKIKQKVKQVFSFLYYAQYLFLLHVNIFIELACTHAGELLYALYLQNIQDEQH
ncbi:hypothetical protein A3860_21500 [Niastella vici]|uniref:Uncharacterized protein n=1 Tax=Niastella vici TaxID=1703345 RepID=A0A1V9G053_9BACT|nr:hypothetical protein A3860_21500 [Niastella vici]